MKTANDKINLQFNADVMTNYLKENKMSVPQFCKKCGISTSTYYKSAKKKLNVRINIVCKIANTINCSTDLLLGRKERLM